MKLFKLEWSWYEDYEFYLFGHTDKTKEDFDFDCKSLIRQYGDEYLSQERSWAGGNGFVNYISKKLHELGYINIETESFGLWGGYILDSKDSDWKDILGDGLFQRAVDHNKKLNEDLT